MQSVELEPKSTRRECIDHRIQLAKQIYTAGRKHAYCNRDAITLQANIEEAA
jgi:hypothetical protein